MDTRVGTIIAGYRIESMIGRGVVATIPLHVVQPPMIAASEEEGVWVADTSGGHTQAESG